MQVFLRLSLVLASACALCMGGCRSYQKGVDVGYAQASSDLAKREYFAKQRAEERKSAGRTAYYVFDEAGKTDAAGRKKAPGSKAAVPIVEPEPVP